MPAENFLTLLEKFLKADGGDEVIDRLCKNDFSKDEFTSRGPLIASSLLSSNPQIKRNALLLRAVAQQLGIVGQRNLDRAKADYEAAMALGNPRAEVFLAELNRELATISRDGATDGAGSDAPAAGGAGIAAVSAPLSHPTDAAATRIVSKPTSKIIENDEGIVTGIRGGYTRGGALAHGFGYSEKQGVRTSQEDALSWERLPDEWGAGFTAKQIGERLWTSYQNIGNRLRESGDSSLFYQGATAITTIVKGNTLITGYLGDAAAFAVIYDEEGKVINVQRLNKRVHKPSETAERERVISLGGTVSKAPEEVGRMGDAAPLRVSNAAAISRAMGDFGIVGMCNDAHIDYLDLPPDAHHVQIITTCDGFTDAAGLDHQTKDEHEAYLARVLSEINGGFPGKMSEEELAEHLASRALADASTDNVSVAVQSVKKAGRAIVNHCLLGVYDGHGGQSVSHYMADYLADELKSQVVLSQANYEAQATSTVSKSAEYIRDHFTEFCGESLGSMLTDASSKGKIIETLRLLSTLPPESHYAVVEELATRVPSYDGLRDIVREVPFIYWSLLKYFVWTANLEQLYIALQDLSYLSIKQTAILLFLLKSSYSEEARYPEILDCLMKKLLTPQSFDDIMSTNWTTEDRGLILPIIRDRVLEKKMMIVDVGAEEGITQVYRLTQKAQQYKANMSKTRKSLCTVMSEHIAHLLATPIPNPQIERYQSLLSAETEADLVRDILTAVPVPTKFIHLDRYFSLLQMVGRTHDLKDKIAEVRRAIDGKLVKVIEQASDGNSSLLDLVLREASVTLKQEFNIFSTLVFAKKANPPILEKLEAFYLDPTVKHEKIVAALNDFCSKKSSTVSGKLDVLKALIDEVGSEDIRKKIVAWVIHSSSQSAEESDARVTILSHVLGRLGASLPSLEDKKNYLLLLDGHYQARLPEAIKQILTNEINRVITSLTPKEQEENREFFKTSLVVSRVLGQKILIARVTQFNLELQEMAKPKEGDKDRVRGSTLFASPSIPPCAQDNLTELYGTIDRLTKAFSQEASPSSEAFQQYKASCTKAVNDCKEQLVNYRRNSKIYEFFASWTRRLFACINKSCREAYEQDRSVASVRSELVSRYNQLEQPDSPERGHLSRGPKS